MGREMRHPDAKVSHFFREAPYRGPDRMHIRWSSLRVVWQWRYMTERRKFASVPELDARDYLAAQSPVPHVSRGRR